MKTFQHMVAQGELMIRKIESLPDNIQRISSENNQYIVGHSETGHHHVIDEVDSLNMWQSADAFIAYITTDEPVELKHLRTDHRHESILIEPGIYEIRRQREYTPAGLRRVLD